MPPPRVDSRLLFQFRVLSLPRLDEGETDLLLLEVERFLSPEIECFSEKERFRLGAEVESDRDIDRDLFTETDRSLLEDVGRFSLPLISLLLLSTSLETFSPTASSSLEDLSTLASRSEVLAIRSFWLFGD